MEGQEDEELAGLKGPKRMSKDDHDPPHQGSKRRKTTTPVQPPVPEDKPQVISSSGKVNIGHYFSSIPTANKQTYAPPPPPPPLPNFIIFPDVTTTKEIRIIKVDNLNLHEGITRKRIGTKLKQFKFIERKSDARVQPVQQTKTKAINRSSDMSPALCSDDSKTVKVLYPEEEFRTSLKPVDQNLQSRQSCFRKLGENINLVD